MITVRHHARCRFGSAFASLLLGFACLAAGPAAVFGQSAALIGFVSDHADGQPLEGVNVVLTGPGGARFGAATDRDGAYQITGVPPGSYILTGTYIGYTPYTDSLQLAAGQRLARNFDLRLSEEAIDEVVVESERTEGVARVTAGLQVITPESIELVPAPDVSGDLVGYLQTLPGVVSSGDRGGQLFIRGGEPSQNMVLLDGMLVYQPFHIVGFYSAFPSDIILRTDMYAGGFGARFGERISSVIDVWSRNGNMRRYAGSAAVSPFMSSLMLEGPILPNRMSLMLSARQSMVEDYASRVIGRDLPYQYGDAFAKLYFESTAKSRLSLSALRTYDRGTLVEATTATPSDQMRWTNEALGIRYLILPGVLPVALDTRLSYSKLNSEQGESADPDRSSSIHNYRATVDASFSGPRLNVDAGMQVMLLTLDADLGGLYQNVENRRSTLTSAAQYVEMEIDLGRGLLLRPGLRMQFYQIQVDPVLEPRVRIVWRGGMHQLSAAAGIYRQEILGISDRRDAASIFTAWTNVPQRVRWEHDIIAGRLPRAVHAIAGYRATPLEGLDLAVEGFYKDLRNMFVAEWTAYPRFTTNLQPARGRVLGIDLRTEFRKGPFQGSLSYGLSSTRYEAEMERLLLWYGDETMQYRPSHDRRHQVNALVSTRVKGFDLSARWEFGSGLPFSRAIGFDGFMLLDDVMDVSKEPASRRVIYERPFNSTLPTYHRLDISVERQFELGAVDVTALASLINSYDRRNLYYLDVFTLARADQLPLIPSFGVKVSF